MESRRSTCLSVLQAIFLAFAPLASTAVAEHRVLPKTSIDHPQFAIRSHVLSDAAILAYYVRDAGAGRPTLVLVPETHGDRSQFFDRTFLENIPAEIGLVVIESRGQGRSWPPPAPGQATIERYASDVLEIVEQLRPAKWYVGGHSLGGMIAIEIAGRRPAGLRGVIALEGWAHHSVQRNAFPERTPRTEAQRADARAQREERYRSQRWTAEESAGLGKAWTAWARGEQILRETAFPVLTVWGDRGMPASARPGREKLLLPDRPDVSIVWIEGADHYITDSPFAAQVARAITRFIAQVEAAPLGTRTRLSRDQGATWVDEITLRDDAITHDVGPVFRPESPAARLPSIITVLYHPNPEYT